MYTQKELELITEKMTTMIFLNYNRESEAIDEFKKSKSVNKSTLSLHIAAYENSIDAYTSDSVDGEREGLKSKSEKTTLIKKWKASKQSLKSSSSFIQNPFEFPRQQEEDQIVHPEVMQFKASQQLLNPNEENLNVNERHNTIPSSVVQKNRPSIIVNLQQQQSDRRYSKLYIRHQKTAILTILSYKL